MKLAEALSKNRRNIITPNDVEFIQGSKDPKIIYFNVPSLIKDLNVLVMYLRQNMARFLSDVTC